MFFASKIWLYQVSSEIVTHNTLSISIEIYHLYSLDATQFAFFLLCKISIRLSSVYWEKFWWHEILSIIETIAIPLKKLLKWKRSFSRYPNESVYSWSIYHLKLNQRDNQSIRNERGVQISGASSMNIKNTNHQTKSIPARYRNFPTTFQKVGLFTKSEEIHTNMYIKNATTNKDSISLKIKNSVPYRPERIKDPIIKRNITPRIPHSFNRIIQSFGDIRNPNESVYSWSVYHFDILEYPKINIRGGTIIAIGKAVSKQVTNMVIARSIVPHKATNLPILFHGVCFPRNTGIKNTTKINSKRISISLKLKCNEKKYVTFWLNFLILWMSSYHHQVMVVYLLWRFWSILW